MCVYMDRAYFMTSYTLFEATAPTTRAPPEEGKGSIASSEGEVTGPASAYAVDSASGVGKRAAMALATSEPTPGTAINISAHVVPMVLSMRFVAATFATKAAHGDSRSSSLDAPVPHISAYPSSSAFVSAS
mmetsp:Transcript_7286/g.24202  ORF Transcript_7286/g.24202 Transcript_7286/m.24202 type:complete len:131 (+) Transcript_7286:2926-3318(+)